MTDEKTPAQPQDAAPALGETEPTAEQLRAHGYAPGGYTVTCHGCRERLWNLDKRAIRCKLCATAAFTRTLAAAPAAPPADGGTEGLRETLTKLVKMAAPFARRIYNDNGDVTVSDTRLVTYEQWVDLYFAHRQAEAAISSRTPAGASETFPRGAGTGTYFRRLPDDTWVMLNSGDQWVTVPAPTWSTPAGAASDLAGERCGYTECAALGRTVCEDCRPLRATRPATPAPAASPGGEGAGQVFVVSDGLRYSGGQPNGVWRQDGRTTVWDLTDCIVVTPSSPRRAVIEAALATQAPAASPGGTPASAGEGDLRKAAQAVMKAFEADCVDGERQYPDDPAYNLDDKGKIKLTTGMVWALRDALDAIDAALARPVAPAEDVPAERDRINLDAALTAFFQGETKPWVFVVSADQEAFKDKLKGRLHRAILASRPTEPGGARGWKPTGAGRGGLNGSGEHEWFCSATGVRQYYPYGFNPNTGRYEGMTFTTPAARPASNDTEGAR